MQDENPAASAANELKAAARDVLRMGSRWAHAAREWIDDRRIEMNNRNRDERDREDRERAQRSRPTAPGYEADTYGGRNQFGNREYAGRSRSDRDIQSDYSGGGYDQLSGYGSERGYESRAHEGREDRDFRERGYGRMASEGDRLHGYQRERGSREWEERGHEDRHEPSRGYEAQGYGSERERSLSSLPEYGTQGRYGAQGSRSLQGYGSSGYGDYARDIRRGGEPGREGYEAFSGQEYGGREFGSPGYGQGSQYGRYGSMGYRGLGPKNYTRSDERIREDLNERLTDADDIDASGLSVEVNNGIATLTGTVGQRWMKHRAEDIAESCSGVRDVRNQIQVSQQSAGLAGSSYASTPGSTTAGGTATTRTTGSAGPSPGMDTGA